jgi:hypothetical protein
LNNNAGGTKKLTGSRSLPVKVKGQKGRKDNGRKNKTLLPAPEREAGGSFLI